MADEPIKLDISDEMIAERRGGSGKMPDDMPLWMAKSIVNIDKFSKWVGNVVCWILIPLIFAMTYEVFARKLFHSPSIWAYDISRFLYGALFNIVAGYFLADYLGEMPPIEAFVSMTTFLIVLSIFYFIPTGIVILWAPT